jgi:hypothetical protein
MEKGKSDMTTEEVIEAGNRLHEIAFQSVIRNGALNTGNLASVIAIAWRLSFAYAERGTGLEAARQAFSPALNNMMDALIDGAWDEVNQKVK